MHKLLNTNAHLGYQTATSNFQPYLYGFRNQIAIIDLENTLRCLRRVCSVIQIIIRSKGHLLFVNTNPEYNNIVRQTAERTGQSFINHKWIGGLLTNWNHMQNVHRHFKLFSNDHFEQANKVPTYPIGDRKEKDSFGDVSPQGSPPGLVEQVTPRARYEQLPVFYVSKNPPTANTAFDEKSYATKKQLTKSLGSKKQAPTDTKNNSLILAASAQPIESVMFNSRSIMNTFPRFQKMQKCFEGILTQDRPDCIIVFNANQNGNAIEEANRLKIPIICLVDSNVSNKLQNMITYPIPANADSLQFVYILCNSIFKTIMYSQKNSKSLEAF